MVKGKPKHKTEKINRVKEVLKKQGRTQAWLADELGRGRNTIASICNNYTQPHLRDLKEIARILNVNIRELLYDTPVK
jgi:transcriptional regulator with XRE-family HTH domain